jgi:hypothetical protein
MDVLGGSRRMAMMRKGRLSGRVGWPLFGTVRRRDHSGLGQRRQVASAAGGGRD